MASLGILPKAQRLLDAIAGLAIGWYRIPTRGPQPAANPNNHYVLPQAAIIARVNDAAEALLPQSSFPPLFWVSRALSGVSAPHIWDFGGGYGEAFFRFRRYMPDLRYTVTEIPEIVASARQISSLSPVAFTEHAPELCDLFFSSGVVMPAHECVFTAIQENRPPLVLVSSVEVTDRPTYWSLVVMRRYGRRCPYVTFNRREFVERVEAMGYRLLDSCRQGLSSSGAWLNLQAQPEVQGFLFKRICQPCSLLLSKRGTV